MLRLLLILTLLLGATPKETRLKIAVIDTGLNITPAIKPYLCKEGHATFVSKDLGDRIGHGTAVAELIAQEIDPDQACLVIIKWYDPVSAFHPDDVLNSFRQAIKIGAKVINFSAGGMYASDEEYQLIKQMLDAGSEFVVAAGNSSQDLDKACNEYPACYGFKKYRNFTVVGALDGDTIAYYSNYGGPITAYRDGKHKKTGMQGTSFAAPVVAGEIAAELSNGRKK